MFLPYLLMRCAMTSLSLCVSNSDRQKPETGHLLVPTSVGLCKIYFTKRKIYLHWQGSTVRAFHEHLPLKIHVQTEKELFRSMVWLTLTSR